MPDDRCAGWVDSRAPVSCRALDILRGPPQGSSNVFPWSDVSVKFAKGRYLKCNWLRDHCLSPALLSPVAFLTEGGAAVASGIYGILLRGW